MKIDLQNTLNNKPRDALDDPEAESNLVGFYDLLLQIDKRVNPQNYSINNDQKYD